MESCRVDVVIRPARRDDVPRLAAVETAAAARFAAVGIDGAFLEQTADPRELEHAAHEGRLWVAEREQSIVGFALATLLEDGEPWLEELDVHPDHGRRGIGRALVDAVVAWARGRGASTLALATFRDVPWNAPLYARLGFVEVPAGERSPAHLGVVEAERLRGLPVGRRVLMRRPLATGTTTA